MPENEDGVTPEPNEDNAPTDTEPKTDPDAGAKKALVAERAARKAAESEAARLRAEIASRDKPAEEIALDNARAEARAEATKAANARIIRAELKAAATGKLANPAVAEKLIDLSAFEVSDDGDIDADALNEAITSLLKAEPYLAAVTAPRFVGGGDGGAKPPAKPTASLDEQIATAHAAHDWKTELRLQNQKMPNKPA